MLYTNKTPHYPSTLSSRSTHEYSRKLQLDSNLGHAEHVHLERTGPTQSCWACRHLTWPPSGITGGHQFLSAGLKSYDCHLLRPVNTQTLTPLGSYTIFPRWVLWFCGQSHGQTIQLPREVHLGTCAGLVMCHQKLEFPWNIRGLVRRATERGHPTAPTMGTGSARLTFSFLSQERNVSLSSETLPRPLLPP